MIHPSLTAHALDDLGARTVWAAFARAIGAEALMACYGWPFVPTMLRPGETAWTYNHDDHFVGCGARATSHDRTVGWGSLIKDPTTPLYWYASGVFPAFQGQGYRQAIRQHVCREAFARGAEAVSLVVLGTNPDHLWRCHREASAGSPWTYSGNSWRPTPFSVFTLLRQDATQLADDLRTCADPHREITT